MNINAVKETMLGGRQQAIEFELDSKVTLSIVWGDTLYCYPRKLIGDDWTAYQSVEIALLGPSGFVRPEEIGLDEYVKNWDGDDVAGYVPVADVGRIICLLEAKERNKS